MGISEKDIINWGLYAKFKREIIIDECIKDLNEPNEEEKNKLKENFIKDNNLQKKSNLNEWLLINGFDIDSFKVSLARKWKWENWCQNKFKNEIESYYLKKKKELDRITFSLIRLNNGDLARELYLRIKEKESTFNEIAKQFSLGKEKDNGGLIENLNPNLLHPSISKILFSSKEKELHKPLKIDNQYVILRLEKINFTTLNNETKKKLSNDLGEEYLYKKILMK